MDFGNALATILGVIAGLDPAIQLFRRRWITGSRAFGAAR
jgi:hypothetical protein